MAIGQVCSCCRGAVGFALLLTVVVLQNPGVSAAQRARIRPPKVVDCSRDHLTAFTGEVAAYTRRAEQTTIRISTDWDTTEQITIDHGGLANPSQWFLVRGRPFTTADWPRIEVREGMLRDGLRATAWVCDDGRNPIVDWFAPEESPPRRENRSQR